METNKSLEQYRQEVKKLCQKLITVAQNVINSEKEQDLNLHQLASYGKLYAENVQRVCKEDKYDLCFIGQYGIGKTTFISFLLDLFDRGKLISSKQLKDCCLFKTEAGQTTLCKMKIFFNAEESKFEIVGSSIDAFKGHLLGFVDYIYANDMKKDFLISKEKVRAIGNMLRISNKAIRREDIREEIQKLLELQLSSDPLDKNEIVEKLFEKSNYVNRDKIEIKFNESPKFHNFFDWLQTYSKAINDCTLKYFPFPDEINLH